MRMRIIGLTGGIGSGKSTIAELFAALGAPLIDTDQIAHALSAPGQPGAVAVAALFGQDYLDADGAIDRPRLRTLIFGDAGAKSTLEATLHPLIRAEAMRQLATLPRTTPYALLIVPLLFETGAYSDVIDRTLVVDCPEALQIARVRARSQLDEETIQRILNNQIARSERLKRADDVIENNGDLSQLPEKVKKLHEIYRQGPESE